MLGIAGDANIQWVHKGELVILRLEAKFPRYSIDAAPRVRFSSERRPTVPLNTNEDHYGIVVDKYRVSEKWGNDRNRLIWVYHVLIGDAAVLVKATQSTNGVQAFLRKAENTEDDRQDLSNNQGTLANESTDSRSAD